MKRYQSRILPLCALILLNMAVELPVWAQQPQSFASSIVMTSSVYARTRTASATPLSDTTGTLEAARSLAWQGMESAWLISGDGRYFKAIQHDIDWRSDFSSGSMLLLLYKVLNQEKYYKAATALYQQWMSHYRPAGRGDMPETGEALSEDKAVEAFLQLPFCAEYASLFHDQSAFEALIRQYTLLDRLSVASPAVVPSGGSRTQPGALELRALSILNAIEFFPSGDPGRNMLLQMLRRNAALMVRDRIKASDSATAGLLAYVLAKGVRLNYLPASFLETARRHYHEYAGTGPAQSLKDGLLQTASGSQPLLANQAANPWVAGALLLAAGEMDRLANMQAGKGRTVMLDYYFNNEHKKDITGHLTRFHYTWEDWSNSGFSLFGHVFRQFGMRTDSLPDAPDGKNLDKASIYIIVDPDDERESPSPHFMDPERADKIADWVKKGGVLVLMSNDSANAEFHHFNQLPERFGIHFNEDCRNKVTGNQYAMGAFAMTGSGGIFRNTRQIYIKEISTLKLSSPATSFLTDHGDVIIGVARYGKGTVFAVGDPWFYNEYLDGRKLPAEYDNFDAAKDLVKWLISRIP